MYDKILNVYVTCKPQKSKKNLSPLSKKLSTPPENTPSKVTDTLHSGVLQSEAGLH